MRKDGSKCIASDNKSLMECCTGKRIKDHTADVDVQSYCSVVDSIIIPAQN